ISRPLPLLAVRSTAIDGQKFAAKGKGALVADLACFVSMSRPLPPHSAASEPALSAKCLDDRLTGFLPVGQKSLQPLVGERVPDQCLEDRRRDGCNVSANQCGLLDVVYRAHRCG